jgi:hypothetical protein
MQDVISNIAAANGLDVSTTEKAIGMILSFLKKEGDQGAVQQMIDALPGADALAAAQGGESSGGGLMGGLMGMMPGGGVMALGTQLMGAGLSMGQIQGVSKQLFEAAKEKAGEDVMGQIVGSVPGLGQFV